MKNWKLSVQKKNYFWFVLKKLISSQNLTRKNYKKNYISSFFYFN